MKLQWNLGVNNLSGLTDYIMLSHVSPSGYTCTRDTYLTSGTCSFQYLNTCRSYLPMFRYYLYLFGHFINYRILHIGGIYMHAYQNQCISLQPLVNFYLSAVRKLWICVHMSRSLKHSCSLSAISTRASVRGGSLGLRVGIAATRLTPETSPSPLMCCITTWRLIQK